MRPLRSTVVVRSLSTRLTFDLWFNTARLLSPTSPCPRQQRFRQHPMHSRPSNRRRAQQINSPLSIDPSLLLADTTAPKRSRYPIQMILIMHQILRSLRLLGQSRAVLDEVRKYVSRLQTGRDHAGTDQTRTLTSLIRTNIQRLVPVAISTTTESPDQNLNAARPMLWMMVLAALSSILFPLAGQKVAHTVSNSLSQPFPPTRPSMNSHYQ